MLDGLAAARAQKHGFVEISGAHLVMLSRRRYLGGHAGQAAASSTTPHMASPTPMFWIGRIRSPSMNRASNTVTAG
jgi:hypothetical protein